MTMWVWMEAGSTVVMQSTAWTANQMFIPKTPWEPCKLYILTDASTQGQ